MRATVKTMKMKQYCTDGADKSLQVVPVGSGPFAEKEKRMTNS